MSPREGLTPKQITDKNGKQTTVYVRDNDGSNGANGEKVKKVSPQRSMKSPSSSLERLRDSAGPVVYGTPPNEKTGASSLFRVDPELGGDDGMVEASIERKDGTEVWLYDSGSYDGTMQPVTGTFDDHQEVELTDDEFTQLNKAHEASWNIGTEADESDDPCKSVIDSLEGYEGGADQFVRNDY